MSAQDASGVNIETQKHHTMGFFSDPASAPTSFVPSSFQPKGNKASREVSADGRARRSFRRSQTFDSSSISPRGTPIDSALSPEAEAREGRRRASRISILSTRGIPGRSTSHDSATVMDSSLQSNSMQDHLEDIEQFLSVVKGAGRKQRNQILRSSLESKQETQRNVLLAEYGLSPS